MIQLPVQLSEDFSAYLVKRGVGDGKFGEYQKWLRFFLDFCEKYKVTGNGSAQLRSFMNKLREKNQSEEQRRRAYHAVSLYFEMLEAGQAQSITSIPAPESEAVQQFHTQQEITNPFRSFISKSHYSEAGYQVTSDSPEWDIVMEKLAGEIKVRHYSRKTLKT